MAAKWSIHLKGGGVLVTLGGFSYSCSDDLWAAFSYLDRRVLSPVIHVRTSSIWPMSMAELDHDLMHSTSTE